ncbi:MAG TPA: hypothetical protein VGK67_07550 [Myxococcales bacterium]|jgi:citrate lyase beta subunit
MRSATVAALFFALAVPGLARAQSDQTGELFRTSHGLSEIVRVNAQGCAATAKEVKAYRTRKLDGFNKQKAATKAWLGKLDQNGQKAYLERNKQQIMRNATESAEALNRFSNGCKKEAPAVRAVMTEFNFQ